MFLTRRSIVGGSFNFQVAADQTSRTHTSIPINLIPEILLFYSRDQFLRLNPYLSFGLSVNPKMVWPILGLGFYIPTPWKSFIINAHASSGRFCSSVSVSIGYVL